MRDCSQKPTQPPLTVILEHTAEIRENLGYPGHKISHTVKK